MSNRNPKETEGALGLVGGLAKKALFLSLGTVFMTEENIRPLLKEYKLPKDIGNFILENAQKGKNEFYRLLIKEFAKILARTDFTKELQKFLKNNTINIKVSFGPKKR